MVNILSTNCHLYPGYMKMLVSPDVEVSLPFFAHDSRTLTVVVPTARIFLPDVLALFSAVAVLLSIVNHSECILWSLMSSTFTGSNVPRPTWSVTKYVAMPFFSRSENTFFVKWSPAVGAATEPSSFA